MPQADDLSRSPILLAGRCALLLFLAAVPGCSQPPVAAKQRTQLKELHDSGVLSDSEYQAKLAALNGGNTPKAGPERALAATGKSGPTQVWKLKKVEFQTMIGYDSMPMWGIEAVPQRQIVGASIMAPVEWETKFLPDNNPTDCNYDIGRLAVLSVSPDKKSGFLIFPARATIWANNRMILQGAQHDNVAKLHNCEAEAPPTLEERATKLIRKFAPNARLAGTVEPISGLTDKLPAMLQQANQQLAQGAAQSGLISSTLSAQAGRMRYSTHDDTGDSDGYVYILQVVRTDQSRMGTMMTADAPIQFIASAPQGSLEKNDMLFQAMAGSFTLAPEYQQNCMQISANIQKIDMLRDQRLNQIAGEMAADNARTAQNIANINAGVAQYRNQVINNVHANRSAALEHSSQQFSMYMGDQAMYHNAATGQNVQLPSGAGHVWASTTGNSNEYILTNSPSYNPNGNAGSASWSQMQEVR